MAATDYFVLTLPLRPEPWQADKLNKRFEVNRHIYNALLGGGWKRYKQMIYTRRYRGLIEHLDAASSEKDRKSIYKQLDQLAEEYRLRRYDFSKDATQYRKYFEENTDAPVVQNLAVNAWKSVQAAMKLRSKEVHFKKTETLMSLEGKTNQTSIRYKDGVVIWKGLKIPVLCKNNAYEEEALTQEIRYCRIKWKWIRGKKKYYVDLILKGKCPVKKIVSWCVGSGRVGIDLGLKQIVCVSDQEIYWAQVPSKSSSLETKKKKLAQKMERSRRVMNPQNYDEFGRILPTSYFWQYSINYRMYKQQFREISRKQMAIREAEQNKVLKQIMQMGDCFYTEKLDYAKMKRKFYGRKIEQTAMGSFLKRLEWKLQQYDKKLVLANPVEAKAGSLDHTTGQCEKDMQKKRFRSIEGHLVDKQAYSAFLLKHLSEVTGKIQLDSCRTDYRSFLDLYRRFTLEEKVS